MNFREYLSESMLTDILKSVGKVVWSGVVGDWISIKSFYENDGVAKALTDYVNTKGDYDSKKFDDVVHAVAKVNGVGTLSETRVKIRRILKKYGIEDMRKSPHKFKTDGVVGIFKKSK